MNYGLMVDHIFLDSYVNSFEGIYELRLLSVAQGVNCYLNVGGSLLIHGYEFLIHMSSLMLYFFQMV